MSWLKKLVNVVLVATGMAICLYGAVHNTNFFTTIAVLAVLLIHIAIVHHRLPEASVIIMAGIIGSFIEVLNINFGFYDYAGFEEQAASLPTWIVLLWFVVGSAVRHVLAVFCRKVVIMPVGGLIGALTIFAAGALSGAIRFQPTDEVAMGLAVLLWASAITFIMLVGHRFFQTTCVP